MNTKELAKHAGKIVKSIPMLPSKALEALADRLYDWEEVEERRESNENYGYARDVLKVTWNPVPYYCAQLVNLTITPIIGRLFHPIKGYERKPEDWFH